MRRVTQILRRLIAAPMFTLVAVATLGIGIGANAAMFSVINGVLLKPLPFHEPERLVGVWHTAPGLGIDLMNQSPATYLTYRDEKVFDEIGLWARGSGAVTGLEQPERIELLSVTDGTLAVLGVQPMIGRRFTAKDDGPGAAKTVMLLHGYWQRRFGGDPKAVGRSLTLDNEPHEIIGILPPEFQFLRTDPAVVVPMQFNRAELHVGNFSYQGVARLKSGTTMEQASGHMARLIPTVADRFPLPKGLTRQMFDEVRMGPNVALDRDVIGDVDKVLWLLLGTVGLVLLIACANVANLFLVRAEGRQRELAVRAALGASWWQLARELLSEAFVLGLAGGALGLLIADAAIRLLLVVGPQSLPRLEEIAIDPTVLAFTVGLSLLSGLLFGLIPVLKYATPRIVPALMEGGRSVSDGRRRHAARNALVVSQIALALVLLVASGLMIRTFIAMRNVQPGFVRPDEVLTVRIGIPEALVKDEAQTARLHEQIMRNIMTVPGVTAVGMSSSITMDGNNSNDPIFTEDFPAPEGQLPPLRRFKWVAPGWFKAIGNPIVAGRDFTWDDIHNMRPYVIVSDQLARTYWKDPSKALGRRIRQTPDDPWREIIGVAGDERDDGVAQPAPAMVYWPMLLKEFWTSPTYVARSLRYAVRTARAGSPTLLSEVQQAVWSVNPNLPVANVRMLQEIFDDSMAQTSFTLVMLALAGGVALLLGLVGIYGVIAYVVAQRTREIGIRIALGAQQQDVRRLFLRHGVVLTTIGIAIGLVAAGAATRLMSALLYGVKPLDALTFTGVAIGLSGIALLASYLPARRAARVDPAIALRLD